MVVATIGAKSAAFLREKGRCPMPRRLLVGFSYALTALLLVLPGQTAAQRYGGWHGGGYRPAYVGYRGYGYGYYPRYLAYPRYYGYQGYYGHYYNPGWIGGGVVIGYGGRHRGSVRPDSAGRIDLADDLLRSLDPGALSPARAAGLLCAISYALGEPAE